MLNDLVRVMNLRLLGHSAFKAYCYEWLTNFLSLALTLNFLLLKPLHHPSVSEPFIGCPLSLAPW